MSGSLKYIYQNTKYVFFLIFSFLIFSPECTYSQELREIEVSVPNGNSTKTKTIFCNGNTPGNGKIGTSGVKFTAFSATIKKLKKKNTKSKKLTEYKILQQRKRSTYTVI